MATLQDQPSIKVESVGVCLNDCRLFPVHVIGLDLASAQQAANLAMRVMLDSIDITPDRFLAFHERDESES